MADNITLYHCLACTGPLNFDGESGKLKCDYCGTTFTVEEVEEFYRQKEQEAAAAHAEKEAEAEKLAAEMGIGASGAGSGMAEEAGGHVGVEGGWSSEEAASIKAYSCPACGAELLCTDTTAATNCPYCGNPAILPGQFTGGLKPDLIIPFKLKKEDAIKALEKYYKGKKFLPNDFKDKNHIEEIKGVYVPFWLYDCTASGSSNFACTRTRTWTEGDYQITETDHFNVFREGELEFHKIPADASTQMPDAHMDAVEPFNYDELKPFSTAYLPGYLADKYDVEIKENEGRIHERAKKSLEDALRDTVTGYSSVIGEGKNLRVNQGKVNYALMPVWMLSTKWKDQNFLFAMNGQTGKLIGDLPVDKGKYWKWFAGIAVPVFAIVSIISQFIL